MAEKKSFVLRIDERTFAALEKWAADEFRSVNGQLEWLIVKALRDGGRMPKILDNEKKEEGNIGENNSVVKNED
jgi:hypothetical protein